MLREVYKPLFLRDTPIVSTTIETAELTKYAANAFLAVKISFINEIASVCEAVGADVSDLAKGIGMDGRIGSKFLHPGPGYGGSCFPKDTLALMRIVQEYGESLRIVEAAVEVNAAQKARMVKKIRDIVKAGSTFNPDYQPYKNHGVWTERHLAFAWLTFITAFEMTGHEYYAVQARHFADLIFFHQSHPPNHRVHGLAPSDGGLMHSIEQHEGNYDNKSPYWIFSPWMTAILVDAMQRYYLHSKDSRVLKSAMRFADAIIQVANEEKKIKNENGRFYLEGVPSNGFWTNFKIFFPQHGDRLRDSQYTGLCARAGDCAV